MPALSNDVQDARYRDECAAAGVLEAYDELRAAGNNPGFAAMLALRTPPGSKTDREFVRDFGHGKQFDKMGRASREYILGAAKKAGINISGKIFKSGLGPPSDPLAWVSDSSDVLRTARIKNLNVSGRVTHEATEVPPPPKKLLADDILAERVAKKLDGNPTLAAQFVRSKKTRAAVREQVLAEAVPAHKRKLLKKG